MSLGGIRGQAYLSNIAGDENALTTDRPIRYSFSAISVHINSASLKITL